MFTSSVHAYGSTHNMCALVKLYLSGSGTEHHQRDNALKLCMDVVQCIETQHISYANKAPCIWWWCIYMISVLMQVLKLFRSMLSLLLIYCNNCNFLWTDLMITKF